MHSNVKIPVYVANHLRVNNIQATLEVGSLIISIQRSVARGKLTTIDANIRTPDESDLHLVVATLYLSCPPPLVYPSHEIDRHENSKCSS